MAQLPASETHELTSAVQDYAKAIYTLESRDGEASTTGLATLLEVRPASVSGMLRKLSALGLVEHERYRGVRLTEARAARRARGDPPPPARRAVPRREPRDDLGRGARRGRGARARAVGGARGADRRQARRPDRRPARRPDPQPRAEARRDAGACARGARARRDGDLRPDLGQPSPRCSASSASAASSPARGSSSSSASRSTGRSSSASARTTHVLGATLARAMRVERKATS